METSQDIKQMIKIMSTNIPGGSDFWPLQPSQLFPYNDMDQCLDLHHKIQDLEKRKISKEEVAKVIRHPTIIRHLIPNILCTGLKVARKLEIPNISIDDQINQVQYFLDVLKTMMPDNSLCENGTNFVIGNNELQDILDNTIWLDTNDLNKKAINNLNATLVTYTWAFYWPYFPSAGYETYGPYNVSQKFGRGAKLLIKDYFNLKPTEIWPVAEKNTIKSVRIYQVYLTNDIFINCSNRILSNTNLPSVNILFAVETDSKQILNVNELEKVSDQLDTLYAEQTKFVNNLKDLDKVRKGVMLSYYVLKDFYLAFWNKWYDPKIVETSIKNLGDKFVKCNSKGKQRSEEDLAKLFDPSNDYF